MNEMMTKEMYCRIFAFILLILVFFIRNKLKQYTKIRVKNISITL